MLILRRKITVKWEIVFFPLLFLLLLVLAYYNLIYLNSIRPGKMLEKTMQNMELNFNHLNVDIKERGSGYSLSFKGNILENEVVYGEIPDYSLKIIKERNSGELLIKDLKDHLWKKASEIGLEELENLLISPFELLNSWTTLYKHAKFLNYQTGKEQTGKEKVILLNISPENLQKTGFPHDCSAEELWIECLVFIDEEKLFINRIILSMYDKSSDENIFNRVFSFAPLGDNGSSYDTGINSI